MRPIGERGEMGLSFALESRHADQKISSQVKELPKKNFNAASFVRWTPPSVSKYKVRGNFLSEYDKELVKIATILPIK